MMLGFKSSALLGSFAAGILTACGYSPTTTSALADASQPVAAADYSQAEVESFIRRKLESNSFYGQTSLDNLQIQKTATPGKYKFKADYYEHLWQNHQVMHYNAKGTCNMKTKTLDLTTLEPNSSARATHSLLLR